ncbi:MAG: xylose isomerase [Candidatus Buchananbacteria bacterium]
MTETAQKWFPDFLNPVPFDPDDRGNPFVFRHYNARQQVTVKVKGQDVTKTMEEWLRFSACYWHTACDGGADPFGVATLVRDWNKGEVPLEVATNRLEAIIELMQILGIKFVTFHTLDLIEEGACFSETKERLMSFLPVLKEKLAAAEIKVLWVTAKLFAAPRYANGAATATDPNIWVDAAAQVKLALDIALALNAAGFVFWGGREGYSTLLNTDMGLELHNLARFLRAAVRYKESIGFLGQFYIEPKPKEPTTHQYDFDSATVMNFLQTYDLLKYFKLNVEGNHITLANHTVGHEMAFLLINGMLGSIDANQGTETCDWDTDQFPYSLEPAVEVMLGVLRSGGFSTGGLNFDAKVRRGATELRDLILGFILGMDTYARAFLIAVRINNDGILDQMRAARYRGWQDLLGQQILIDNMSLDGCETIAASRSDYPVCESSHDEAFQRVWAEYLGGSLSVTNPVKVLYPDSQPEQKQTTA